jgi:hypothetical protein
VEGFRSSFIAEIGANEAFRSPKLANFIRC